MASCWCGCCCKTVLLLLGYVLLIRYFQRECFWCWANEWETQCGHPELPANHSGIKVIAAGWPKTGTWTLSSALARLGYNSYHSQEFLAQIWTPLADDYWMRPENGGRKSKTRLSGTMFPTWPWDMRETPGQKAPWPLDDLTVLRNMKLESLAAKTSKCRMEAIATDGLENIVPYLIDASPDVKVLLLDWRAHDGWMESLMNQHLWMSFITSIMELFYGSLHFLPWGLLVKLIDPLVNNDIEYLLSRGAPPFIQECPLGVMLWHPFIKNRHIFSHYAMGLSPLHTKDVSEEDFKGFFKAISEKVPAKNVMSWDFKSKGWEELCDFLEVDQCPDNGKIKTEPNGYTDIWRKSGGRGWKFNCDEPFVLIPLYLVLHWINWKVYTGIVVTLPGLLFWGRGREKAD
eukprot:TRINITY_DN17490_c0_g2_i2.p1 TRINITY_DN17490_c0_g2~~TRINITY_DN17490_c0_g2_i2.p1  ORF type:complete len:402 (-),score=42.67 TRINITY_DN17490_c0_g2_i2:160-1365(-)